MFPTEPVPERIGPYKIVRRVSGAGSTSVYIGRKDGPMGFARNCTLKLVPNTTQGDARFAEELAREAAICGALNHQSIQRMIDFFEHEQFLVLVLEQIDGPSLDRLLSYLEQNKKPLSDAAKAYVGQQVAGALVYAHAMRDENGKPTPIVHRGLHPEHVLVGWDGQVRLSGFQMGKILGRSPDTVITNQKNAPGYKAPEQLRGEQVTPKADVYGLGLFLWALFTGQKPSDKGIRPARLASIRSDLPKLVTFAIDAALETSLEKRPASCRDIEQALGQMPDFDKGRDELCDKVGLLKDNHPAPEDGSRPSLPGAPRPRVSLQSVRPAQPAGTSKERLSTVPLPPPASIRPSASLPPILFDDVQPKSMYPLLRALTEKVPKQDASIPKAPRLPQVEIPPASGRGPNSEKAPRSGLPRPVVAAPLDIDSQRKPRTEWMASVPDEEAFDKLFDEVTSRSPDELEQMGIGEGAEEKPVDAPRRSRRRMEFADTMPQNPLEITQDGQGNAASSLATPPLGPPPAQSAKAVRFGPRPVASAPPKLMRGFAAPPLPPAPEPRRPPIVALAVAFGVVAVAAALAVMAFTDKPSGAPVLPSANALVTKSAPVVMSSAVAPVASSTATAAASITAPSEVPAPPLPYGQGYLTVGFPDVASVYVSGRLLGPTNERLQNKCGRYFVRVASSKSGSYPEWLSAGIPVSIPCQDSIKIEISYEKPR